MNGIIPYYTRAGDNGKTTLVGTAPMDKSHPLFHLLGTLDEGSCLLSMARTLVKEESITNFLLTIQKELLDIGGKLATGKTISLDCTPMENEIDRMQKLIGEFKGFVLPGGADGADYLDLARTVFRRAERHGVEAGVIVPYLNRLSDYLYAAARYVVLLHSIEKAVTHALGSQELTPETARQLVAAVEKRAQDMGVEAVIAVCDQHGCLLHLHRMVNAYIPSITLSQDKAYTAATLKMNTEKVWELSQPGGALVGLTAGNGICMLGGGTPLYQGKQIVGGLGVSGGSVSQDIALAEYGKSVFMKGGVL